MFKKIFLKQLVVKDREKATSQDTKSGKVEAIVNLGFQTGLVNIPQEYLNKFIEEDDKLTLVEKQINDKLKDINQLARKGQEVTACEKVKLIHKLQIKIRDTILKIKQSEKALDEIISSKNKAINLN